MIRRAENKDISVVMDLLEQVHEVHHIARPDLFRDGTTKYQESELIDMIKDDKNPIFVYDDNGVKGYAFCQTIQHINNSNLTDIKTLYIDDLCVDKLQRGRGIGKTLYNYVCKFAKENGYYNLTLNVWADNEKALKFYQSLDLKIQKIGMEKIL